ncbi:MULTISPECIES: lysozyme inhibitor LprI family protein [unclassified Pseudomonas]|uniref:lysozyme inhibitor LprI family protein n=1 Tax=unclassified Pseudomonas TaxID=196821 RepID=UPI00130487ED|nr:MULTISPECIES: lysozyme inhibitor LprI family protein [unclassified Pseudomonas]
MNVARWMFCAFVAMSVSSVSFSQDAGCEAVAAGQRDECAEKAMKAADRVLNDSYDAVIDRAGFRYIFQYQSRHEEHKAFLDRLKNSQRAWIKLRDSNCRLEGFENEWDTTSYSADLNRCAAKMSLERALYLDGILPAH